MAKKSTSIQLPAPLPWQSEILKLPVTSSVLLAGGRYSGKSWLLALLLIRASAPVEQGGHGAAFRGLLLRDHWGRGWFEDGVGEVAGVGVQGGVGERGVDMGSGRLLAGVCAWRSSSIISINVIWATRLILK